MSKGHCGLCKVALWLVIIGGINWLLIGVFDWNLVNAILGAVPWLERIVYILVGLSALVAIAAALGKCKKCVK